MSSFLEFLQSGRLGELACGMTALEFSEFMGGPSTPLGPGRPWHWKSGLVQLTFNPRQDTSTTTLGTITLKPRETDEAVHSALDWRDEASAPPLDFDDFRKWLDQNGIRTVGGNVYGRDRHLALESGVRAEFDEEGLHTVSFTPKRDSESRQVTVNLGKTDLELIKREAAARGLSVSKICSEWIREHAARIQQVESI